jgi:single-stranded DNA-binding protein
MIWRFIWGGSAREQDVPRGALHGEIWYISIGPGETGKARMIECAFVGVLGRDAEVRTSAKGRQHLKMNVRCAEGDDAQWVSTLSFDEQAIQQACAFLKGCKIYIEGRISMNEWQDQSGAKRFGLAAIANHSRLVAIGRHRPRDQGDNGYRQAAARWQRGDDVKRSSMAPTSDLDDEIPF